MKKQNFPDIFQTQFAGWLEEVRGQVLEGKAKMTFVVDPNGRTTIEVRIGEVISDLEPRVAKSLAKKKKT